MADTESKQASRTTGALGSNAAMHAGPVLALHLLHPMLSLGRLEQGMERDQMKQKRRRNRCPMPRLDDIVFVDSSSVKSSRGFSGRLLRWRDQLNLEDPVFLA
jgi:hypothetical protein